MPSDPNNFKFEISNLKSIRLYLVRHGKAAYGWGEQKDPGLSKIGKIQAQSAAKGLAPLGPMPIFTSPLMRTRQTASPLAKIWHIKPQMEPGIAEIPSHSTDSGDRIKWLKEIMTDRWSSLSDSLKFWRRNVVETLLKTVEDAVFISHFIAINVAVGEALNDDRVVVFKPDNASVTILETDQKRLYLIELGAQDQTIVL